jgi:hypothetical protein
MALYIRNQAQHHARKSFDHELKMIFETAWDCSLGRMTQPSLRDFVVPDYLPGIPLTLHAGLLSGAPAALVGQTASMMSHAGQAGLLISEPY